MVGADNNRADQQVGHEVSQRLGDQLGDVVGVAGEGLLSMEIPSIAWKAGKEPKSVRNHQSQTFHAIHQVMTHDGFGEEAVKSQIGEEVAVNTSAVAVASVAGHSHCDGRSW